MIALMFISSGRQIIIIVLSSFLYIFLIKLQPSLADNISILYTQAALTVD